MKDLTNWKCYASTCLTHQPRCVYLLGPIYRPPGADATSVNYIDSVIQCLSSYCPLSRVNIVIDDLNCPKINWLTSSCPKDSINKSLLDCIAEYGFTQITAFAF